jgi:hypothetical protein
VPDVDLLVDLIGDLESDDPIVVQHAAKLCRLRGPWWLAQMGIAHPQALLETVNRKLEEIEAREQERIDGLKTAVDAGEPIAPFEPSE